MSPLENSSTLASASDMPPKKSGPLVFGFLKYVTIGMAITLLLLGGKILFEKWSWGHIAERWTYEFLQMQLTPFDPKKDMPIVVVDIGQQPGGTPREATSREYLTKLIEALVEREPSAIAIDEDFSTNGTGWVTDDDPEFFKFCLKRRKQIPIFLGVHEARAAGPNTWLGLPEYREMAVALNGPKGDTSRMPLWVQYPSVGEKLPSIGFALAREYMKSAPKPKWQWPGWAVYLTTDNLPGRQRHVVGFKDEYDVAEALVNYSKLELIQKLTPPTINTDFIKNSDDMFHNKMVLIGASTFATDASNVPGRDETFAGVLLHACTAYTLAKEPLYEFTNSLRWKLDLGISALVLLSVALMRFVSIKRSKKFPLERWQSRLIYLTVFLVIGTGIGLVRWGGVMWLDFILVIAALLMHPGVEVHLKRLWNKVTGVAPDVATTH